AAGLATVAALLSCNPARAWNEHALTTWVTLQPLAAQAAEATHATHATQAAQAALTERVRAESLERFVAAEATQLERLLGAHEAWARAHLDPYDALPDALVFRAAAAGQGGGSDQPLATASDLRQRFLKALRVNAASRLPLYLQVRPGESSGERPALPWTEVTAITAGSGGGARHFTFASLTEGSEVPALEVLATAAQEPDFGLDIGLYTDSGTAQGREAGLGKQPFGNPALAYGTQAPFHMGLYHEARIVFAAAPFLRRTQPEARIALFTALARHALATGHRYWGWRFAGWALHYLQDLTQPYHASILPGLSALRMIGINTVAMIGWTGPKAAATTLVSNRHAVVESYQQQRLALAWRAARETREADPLLAALRDTAGDAARGGYAAADVRGRISGEAFEAAAALDAQLERSFPTRFTADPQVELGSETDELDMVTIARTHSAAEHERLQQQLAALLRQLGVHTRAFVRTLAEPGGTP
ncbi:MAG: hypothetical protein U1F67_26480, partial [Rubrivivax sp.]